MRHGRWFALARRRYRDPRNPGPRRMVKGCIILLVLSTAYSLAKLSHEASIYCEEDRRLGDNRGIGWDHGWIDTYIGTGPVCGPVRGLCACGEPGPLAAVREREPVAFVRNGKRVCALVRTYSAHHAKIRITLETMLASIRASGRAGLVLDARVLNTETRRLGARFARSLESIKRKGGPELEVRETEHRRGGFRGFRGADFGYVDTDLMLLKLRGRCDFVHVTNGDNVYHVDYFRRQLDELDANPRAAVCATDFWSHHYVSRRATEYAITKVDLATLVFRASYLDSKNITFIVGDLERGRVLNSTELWEADGRLAERVLADVGRARALNVHQALMYHL